MKKLIKFSYISLCFALSYLLTSPLFNQARAIAEARLASAQVNASHAAQFQLQLTVLTYVHVFVVAAIGAAIMIAVSIFRDKA